jgi:ABC-type multidrug transport system ATPase subunit
VRVFRPWVSAIEDASLEVGAGEIVGLVGRNGAGKITLMRSVMGIIDPDRGSITIMLAPIYAIARLATRIYKATVVRSGPGLSWREALRVRPG